MQPRPAAPEQITSADKQEQLDRLLKNDVFRRGTQDYKLFMLGFRRSEDANKDLKEWRQKDIAAELGSAHVRRVATALRRKLAAYYKSRGAQDPLLISMPPGHYELSFSRNPTAAHAITVSATDLRRLIHSICASNGIDGQQEDARFVAWLKAEGRCSDLARLSDAFSHERSFADILAGLKTVTLGSSELRTLACAFDIHPLMLDPLRSERTTTDWLVIDLAEGFFSPGDQSHPFYGSNVIYRIPRRRLANTDAAFVHLTLGEGGESDIHEHPGDEIALVLDGSVEYRFRNRFKTLLNQGDLIHFDAEITHQAVRHRHDMRETETLVGDAKLFIVRFHQLEGLGSRQQLRREVEESHARKGARHGTPSLYREWLLQMISPRGSTGGDRVGLARFLTRVRDRQGIEQIARAFHKSNEYEGSMHAAERERQVFETAHFIAALENAELSMKKESLHKIALLYGIEERLIYSFLQPAVPEVAVTAQKEWIPLDPSISNPGVDYFVPLNNLVAADLSVTRLRLEPLAHTRKNRHPGFELTIPLDGEIEIDYDQPTGDAGTTKQAFRVHSGEVGHYKSDNFHCIRNPSTKRRAEVFVLRFHRDGA